MNNLDLKQASATLLDPAGLSLTQLDKVLHSAAGREVDYSDLFFEYTRHESFMLEDGIVKEGHFNIDQGVGIRVISGEKTGFAYSDEISTRALADSMNSAAAIARQGQNGQIAIPQKQSALSLYSAMDPIGSMSTEDKIRWMKQLDNQARLADSKIQSVIISLSASQQTILVKSLDGTVASDIRPMIRLNVQVIAQSGEKRESGSSGGGGRYDFPELFASGLPEHFVQQAVDQALVKLEAVAAPAGEMPVVLGPGWPGVLLHEAVGHGLEGDFNRKGVSAFSGRIGQRVASMGVTVVDDATLDKRRGSLSIDDEGTAGENTVLIEDGILKAYMFDRHNAALMNTHSTGNGRRESYAHLPMPRMTNTYMLAGQYPHEELIASVKDGIYAANFGGGQVDITSGKFVFSASEAYRIRDGKLAEAVKGATLIGNGPETMNRISMIGNNLELDSGVGVCGKEGQSVPVGVGQPSLKIDGMIVGGTAN